MVLLSNNDGKHFMKGLLLLSLLSTSALANTETYNKQCKFLDKLSPFQYDIAYQSYRVGEEYNLGLTAVAIAWQESKLGLYKVRYGEGLDVSAGIGHSTLYYNTKGMTAFEKGRWFQSMMENNAKSIGYMVRDIVYWQSRSDSWKEGVMRYNSGNGSNLSYQKEVVNIVQELKVCEF